MKKIGLLIALFSLVTVNSLMAQGGDTKTATHTISVDIPAVSLVDIEGETNGSIAMAFIAPIEAGDALTAPNANSQLWLNYSFIPSKVDSKATISVMASGLVEGIKINVQAAAASGEGKGTLGTVGTTPITLGATDVELINTIGASFTGNGVDNGHNLTYTLSYDEDKYAQIIATALPVVVTYTINAK